MWVYFLPKLLHDTKFQTYTYICARYLCTRNDSFMAGVTCFFHRMQLSHDCTYVPPGTYEQSSQPVVPGEKQPWMSCLMPLQRYCSAGLFWDGISCSWFPFVIEGMVNEEEMGYYLHMASVNLGKCWGEFPAGVSPTALDVSRSMLKNCKLERIWITCCFFMVL